MTYKLGNNFLLKMIIKRNSVEYDVSNFKPLLIDQYTEIADDFLLLSSIIKYPNTMEYKRDILLKYCEKRISIAENILCKECDQINDHELDFMFNFVANSSSDENPNCFYKVISVNYLEHLDNLYGIGIHRKIGYCFTVEAYNQHTAVNKSIKLVSKEQYFIEFDKYFNIQNKDQYKYFMTTQRLIESINFSRAIIAILNCNSDALSRKYFVRC